MSGTKERTPIADRVRRGITFLKEVREYLPHGLEDVDLDALNIRSCEKCVLGQLFGGGFRAYFTGKEALDLTDGDTVRMGFTVWGDDWDDEDDEVMESDTSEYEPLTAAWREALAAERAAV